MRRLLTGYAVNFNKRHRRAGHLFRYKSIVCEDDPYLLELTRYIHLNPVRAGMVDGMSGLNKYLWSGHSALMGTMLGEWQDRKTIPDYFGSELAKARKGYESFKEEGVAPGRRPDWLAPVSSVVLETGSRLCRCGAKVQLSAPMRGYWAAATLLTEYCPKRRNRKKRRCGSLPESAIYRHFWRELPKKRVSGVGHPYRDQEKSSGTGEKVDKPDGGAQVRVGMRVRGCLLTQCFNLCSQSSGQPGGAAGYRALYKVALEPASPIHSRSLNGANRSSLDMRSCYVYVDYPLPQMTSKKGIQTQLF